VTLLKIYLYGYLNRVQSSRRLERETQRNIELMWLTGRLMPDFKTIADFRQERQMKQFKSAAQAQRFLSAHDQINNLFHLPRDHVTAAEHRASRTQKFQVWATTDLHL
jgi:transposase-like protein